CLIDIEVFVFRLPEGAVAVDRLVLDRVAAFRDLERNAIARPRGVIDPVADRRGRPAGHCQGDRHRRNEPTVRPRGPGDRRSYLRQARIAWWRVRRNDALCDDGTQRGPVGRIALEPGADVLVPGRIRPEGHRAREAAVPVCGRELSDLRFGVPRDLVRGPLQGHGPTCDT